MLTYIKTSLCCTFLLLLFLQQGFGNTYYISPKGNDQNGNGSMGNPWHSLYYATATVKNPGDIIHVNEGLYTETVQSELAVGVSIEGEGSTSVLTTTVSSEWSALLNVNSAEGTNGNQYISHLKFDGQALSTFWAIHVGGRSNVSIHDCVVVDFADRGVIFEGRSGGYTTAPRVYATGNSFYNNTVTNCAAYKTTLGTYGRGCLNIGAQEGMLIYNNIITQNSRPEGYNGWPIKSNDEGYLRGCKIYGNKLSKIPLGNPNGVSGWDFAIELFNESGLEIFNNNIIGSIDLNRQTKDKYAYSVYIHDNTIGQQKLRPQLENGIVLEFGTEDAVIEKNHFSNIGVVFYFTPRDGSIIENVTIRNNTCENIGVDNNNHEGFAVRFGEEGTSLYYLEKFLICDNKFLGNEIRRPYWGVAILGVSKANNVQVKNNSFSNFDAGFFTANPAGQIDTLSIENNLLFANGYDNKPVFMIGAPQHTFIKNNTVHKGIIFSWINIKMNVIRPLYYELKSANFLLLIAFLAGIFSIGFCIRENVYAFPLGFVAIGIDIFLDTDEGAWLPACINSCFVLLSLYGWAVWSKRDKKGHRTTRVTSSSQNDWLLQVGFFLSCYVVLFFCLRYFKNNLPANSIVWVNALAGAAAFTGMWLLARKKLEAWYWWMITCLASIVIYFADHFILTAAYYCLLLLAVTTGLLVWKKKKERQQKRLRPRYSPGSVQVLGPGN